MRIDRKDDAYQPPMPPARAAYLVGHLWEIGPAQSVGMGSAPITHLEIESWCRLNGIELRPWEVKCLRRLSGEYVAESYRAQEPDAAVPWTPDAEFKHELKPHVAKQRDAIRNLSNL